MLATKVTKYTGMGDVLKGTVVVFSQRVCNRIVMFLCLGYDTQSTVVALPPKMSDSIELWRRNYLQTKKKSLWVIHGKLLLHVCVFTHVGVSWDGHPMLNNTVVTTNQVMITKEVCLHSRISSSFRAQIIVQVWMVLLQGDRVA